MGQKRKRRESDHSESEWTADEDDSDAELQTAFARGDLKPGLNYAADARKEPINNKEKLIQKLEEVRLDLPWIERLDLTNGLAPLAPELAAEIGIDPNLVVRTKKANSNVNSDVNDEDDPVELENVDDDFKRELRFYRQAQAAVLEAIPRLHALGIPTRRPDDYFAEMAKSDVQMKKIREKLVQKQHQMDMSEKAKKLREQRKYGKQVQMEVMKKRQEEKKRLAESVKKFKKGAKGQQDELDFLTEIEGPGNAGHQKGGARHKGPMKKSGKQKYKDSKYGFGGQKKRSKYNTKDSADDVGSRGGFNPKKHGAPSANKRGGKKPVQKQKRPGKVVRQKMKNKRR